MQQWLLLLVATMYFFKRWNVQTSILATMLSLPIIKIYHIKKRLTYLLHEECTIIKIFTVGQWKDTLSSVLVHNKIQVYALTGNSLKVLQIILVMQFHQLEKKTGCANNCITSSLVIIC